MSNYSLELSKSARKFLSKSDKTTRERIINTIHALVESPYSYAGIVKLTGYDNLYRVRVGKYRIVYQVLEDRLLVSIEEIDSRGDIYKRL